MADKDVANFNHVYSELYELIGEENMIKVYESFKGMQISFPSRLYTKEYVLKQILERYTGYNAKELAREYGYTVKYINQMIKEKDMKK